MDKKPLLIDNKWEPQKYLDALDYGIQKQEKIISEAELKIITYNIEKKRVERLVINHETLSDE
jgi:hypothetical protein